MNPADVSYDEGTRTWLARFAQLAPTIPGITSRDPAVQRVAGRTLSDELTTEFTLPVPDGVALDDLELAGLRARRYRPAAASGPAPTQLWLHGGGFFSGSIDEVVNDRLCARRALESGVQLISLEYRLAPEHPYPSQALDAMAALDALVADPGRYEVDPARLGIGGISAGAGIAASVSLRVRDAGGPALVHVDLEVPPTSLPPVGDSAQEYAVGFGLDDIAAIQAMYTGGITADAYLSPLDVPDLRGLPPHLIMVAEYDPLRDSGLRYAERLRAAGVPVELYTGRQMLHASPGMTAISAGSAAWQREHSRLLGLAY